LREARRFLEEGDGVQASEKAWGAATQVLKAVAAREGKELRSHALLWSFVSELREKRGDEEMAVWWHMANSLHTNFYEGWMLLGEVKLALQGVEKFVGKLRSWIQGE